jgi:hypothetical protein
LVLTRPISSDQRTNLLEVLWAFDSASSALKIGGEKL